MRPGATANKLSSTNANVRERAPCYKCSKYPKLAKFFNENSHLTCSKPWCTAGSTASTV